jgi:hypothetical protein
MNPVTAVSNADIVSSVQQTTAFDMLRNALNNQAAQAPQPAAGQETIQDTTLGRNIDIYA